MWMQKVSRKVVESELRGSWQARLEKAKRRSQIDVT
jgi:hypothetical protein